MRFSLSSFLVLVLLVVSIECIQKPSVTVNKGTHTFLAQIRHVNAGKTQWGKETLGFSTAGFPRFRFMSFRQSKDTKSAFGFRAGIISVFEYVPSNATLGYTPGDTTGNEVVLVARRGSSPQWSPIAYSQSTDQTTNITTREAESHSPNSAQWKAQLKLFHSEGDRTTGGRRLTPDAFKFDINIRNFVYSLPNSRLAVKMVVDSAQKRIMHNHNRSASGMQGEVRIGQHGEGYFNWTRTCTADGQTVNIVASPLRPDDHADDSPSGDTGKAQGESRNIVYFSIQAVQPAVVEWDPTVGASSEMSSAARLHASFWLLVLLIAFML
eukprot:gnl/Trimastix_PCT/111.p1 GENE.gnl/Trimastix_PCT/111~~gnl/Trimastix_PCT/111.p1  ORF type:complete len:324 (-),score=85.75 gnl/Trimastix_PCT/111:121-1092(-)